MNRTRTRLILVGGFLGAGKTTILWEAARAMVAKGNRVGLVTNDQAPDLVDTLFLSQKNMPVAEVSGSCFCCNFDGLIQALKRVRKEAQANVIIAEPVGSCTDLSATILQPLIANLQGEWVVSPLSVMADPGLLSDILEGGTGGLHASAAYIFRKQLEESDIILISKSDTLRADDMNQLQEKVRQNYPDREVMCVSAATGEGIEEWLRVVTTRSDAGRRLAEVDYNIYAEGEAVLGWLNSHVELHGKPTDWDLFATRLLRDLGQQFAAMKASVGHIKLNIVSGESNLTGNLTGRVDSLSIRGSAGVSENAHLTLNARIEMSPERLEEVVRQALDAALGENLRAETLTWRCFRPGRPNPTFRFDHVVYDKDANGKW